MRISRHIWVFGFLTLSAVLMPARAQDFARLSERDLQGTARYVGMAGAMTAIGGDPSAVRDNPAGLGLYQRMELLVSLDYMQDRTIQSYNSIDPLTNRRVSISQASLVFTFGDPYRTDGVIYNNLLVSYHRLRTYYRSYQARGNYGASLGSLIAETGVDLGMPYPADRQNVMNTFRLDEAGTVDEYAFDWAMNISHKWYIGAGLRLQTYSLINKATYTEMFNTYADSVPYSLKNETALTLAGVGFGLSAGVIYRPIRWCRFGVSVETPSLGRLTTYTSGTISAQTDSLRYSEAPDLSGVVRNFHLPMRLSASAAAQLGTKALIALQYDYAYGFSDIDCHTLRAGVEIVPIPGLFINLGYAYEWNVDRQRKAGEPERVIPIDPTFDRQDAYFLNMHATQYASFGIGYRGRRIIAQAAYQYRWQQMNLYAHENLAYTMSADTHRLVITLGWHHDW